MNHMSQRHVLEDLISSSSFSKEEEKTFSASELVGFWKLINLLLSTQLLGDLFLLYSDVQ